MVPAGAGGTASTSPDWTENMVRTRKTPTPRPTKTDTGVVPSMGKICFLIVLLPSISSTRTSARHSWHPDPVWARLTTAHRMDEPVWRANFARLSSLNLAFDLLMSPWQAADAARLAADHPDTTIIVNHCGSPMDRDQEGMERWRTGLGKMAEAPNVLIKISDPVAYDAQWSRDSLRAVILTCIDIFGPERCLFASDYPVSGLHIDFATWLGIFRETIKPLSTSERAHILRGTATRAYRLELASDP